MGFCSWTVGFYRVLIFGPAAAPRKAWQVLGSEEMQGSGWNTPVCVSSKGGERGCAAPEIPFLGGERGLADLVTSRSSSLAGWLAGWLAGYPDPEKERLSLLGDSKTVGLPLACQHLEGRGRGASSFLRGREKRERRERKREKERERRQAAAAVARRRPISEGTACHPPPGPGGRWEPRLRNYSRFVNFGLSFIRVLVCTASVRRPVSRP